ncbi:hypothetical protein LPJ70_007045, partial [Coemansia sp. RSA 2708]
GRRGRYAPAAAAPDHRAARSGGTHGAGAGAAQRRAPAPALADRKRARRPGSAAARNGTRPAVDARTVVARRPNARLAQRALDAGRPGALAAAGWRAETRA